MAQLIEGNLVGFRSSRIQRDGAGDERKAQKAFPVRGGRGRWTRYSEQRGRFGLETPVKISDSRPKADSPQMFLLCPDEVMTDRPANWRMPTPKQMEKLANASVVRGNVPPVRRPGPGDEMPPEYWQAILERRVRRPRYARPSIRTQRLADIQRHLLRVACRRCGQFGGLAGANEHERSKFTGAGRQGQPSMARRLTAAIAANVRQCPLQSAAKTRVTLWALNDPKTLTICSSYKNWLNSADSLSASRFCPLYAIVRIS